MNTKIKLIIFDAYGVILNGGYPQTCQALVEKFNMDKDGLYEVIYTKYFNQAAVKQITQQEAWEKAIEELKLPITVEEIKKIHYSFMSIKDEVVNLAQELKKNYQILLLNKNTGPQFQDALDMFPEIKQLFGDNLINTWDYDLPKASRETVDMVCNKFNIKPDEVIYIDDQEQNLIIAKEMGVHTIFFTNFAGVKVQVEKILNY